MSWRKGKKKELEFGVVVLQAGGLCGAEKMYECRAMGRMIVQCRLTAQISYISGTKCQTAINDYPSMKGQEDRRQMRTITLTGLNCHIDDDDQPKTSVMYVFLCGEVALSFPVHK